MITVLIKLDIRLKETIKDYYINYDSSIFKLQKTEKKNMKIIFLCEILGWIKIYLNFKYFTYVYNTNIFQR